jgi:hypothetical protein
MIELRLAVWTVVCGERCRWFPDHASAKEFANNEWDKEVDGVPLVQSKTIWDKEEVCEILNNVESFADNARIKGELRLGVFANRMA